MRIHLQQLEHQQDAIDAILQSTGEDFLQENQESKEYSNYLIKKTINKATGIRDTSYIDVKMETGTGKTYVYTRMMFEMYQKYGLNKFVIVVPSLAIKEGTKSFINSDYARQHFSELFNSLKINLYTVNAGDFQTTSSKRKTISNDLISFCQASRNDKTSINCLLINDQMMFSKSFTRDDYDQTLISGYSSPLDALKQIKPIFIVDEPHRFKRDGKAWKIIDKIDPQLIVRFGATFPDLEISRGKNNIVKKDYENLVHDLNAVEAFNRGLVKFIDVEYPSLNEQSLITFKVMEIKNTGGEKFVRFKRSSDGKDVVLKINDYLSELSDEFGDLQIINTKNYGEAELSNGTSIEKNQVLLPSIFGSTYQEVLIKQAIDAHFEIEEKNFFRVGAGEGAPKIKTLSLFFIDSINSFRGANNENDGWISLKFKEILTNKLNELLIKYKDSKSERSKDYYDFLTATLNDIDRVANGYFSGDKSSSEDSIAEEVQNILYDKEKLLSFKDKNGEWLTTRFLFSLWTLREGWDNPNVFCITKLRTSGSEISKIQEVGRGLRLPVDEAGNRLSDEEFRLRFIIDFSEREFAKKLVGEINEASRIANNLELTDDIINKLIKLNYGKDEDEVFINLLSNKIINRHNVVINSEELSKLLPDEVLSKNAVRDNIKSKNTVKLRKNNFEKIKEFWLKIQKKYMIKYEGLTDFEEDILLDKMFSDSEIFFESTNKILTSKLQSNKFGVYTHEVEKAIENNYNKLEYGKFLEKLSSQTNFSVHKLHLRIVKALKNDVNPNNKINQNTLSKMIEKYHQLFVENFAEKYSYQPLNFTASTSLIKNGGFVDEIPESSLGKDFHFDIQDDERYLYDKYLSDSMLEHQVLKISPGDEVLVFGKIPKRAIRVPTFTGGTSTPDFVYAIKDKNGDVKLNLLIETKASDIRSSEKVAISAQEKLLSNMTNVKWRLVTQSDEVSSILNQLK